MPQSVIQRSFAGGELAPALHARADQAKYLSGLRRCRNFLVQRHGGVTNRAGTRFISACKTNGATVKLARYVSEIDGQSLLLEIGNGYIRFFQNGAALQVLLGDVTAWSGATNYVIGDLAKNGGVIYYCIKAHINHAPPNATYWYAWTGTIFEIPNPFGASLPNTVQSGRVITLTHRSGPPYELEFVALTTWILRAIATEPSIAAPTGVVLTPGGAGALSYGYIVTAGKADTYEESEPSAQVINGACAAPTQAAPNVITWGAVTGAVEYYIYCDPFANGTYGFVGTATDALQFNDSGIDPDFAITPPVPRVLFDAAGGYPHLAAYYQQRRFFAYTDDNPDSIFGSRTGFPSNFGISSPLQDDDALTFRIAGNNHHPIRALVALKALIALTGAGEWTITGGDPTRPLIPNGIAADQQTYVGASSVTPVVIGNAIIYVQARGTVLHDLQFDQQVEGLGGRDLSIYSTHLFEGFTVSEIDYAQTPHSIVWCIRSDGMLLGLTYIREQEVWGWHRHDTGAAGMFEHVCVVPEADEDAVYVIVKRTIAAATKRYIEKLERRLITTFDADAFFVDCGLSYAGAPITNVVGLDHLNGQTVSVLGDGDVITGPFVVAAGAITLPAAKSTIHVGLPITAEIETLDLDVQGSNVRDRKKRVGSLSLLLENSARTFSSGPDSAHLTPYKRKPSEPAADTFTGQIEMNMTSAFNDYGRVFIRQTDPLPITILAVLPNLELGG